MRKLKVRDWHKATEHPCKLGVRRHVTLTKERHLVRINTCREIILHHINRALTQKFWFAHRGKRMQIRHHQKAFILFKKLDRRPERPEIVPNMQLSR